MGGIFSNDAKQNERKGENLKEKVLGNAEVEDFDPPEWVDVMAMYSLAGKETCASGFEYEACHTVIVLSKCGKVAGRAVFESEQGKIESLLEGTWETEEGDDTVHVEYSLLYFGYSYNYTGNLSEQHRMYQGQFARGVKNPPENERGDFDYTLEKVSCAGKATKGAKRAS